MSKNCELPFRIRSYHTESIFHEKHGVCFFFRFGCEKRTCKLVDNKLHKARSILWFWENIRKSLYGYSFSVMFCHGRQNKASRAMDGSLNAGHVTLKYILLGIHRLFLYSYIKTKSTGLCTICHIVTMSPLFPTEPKGNDHIVFCIQESAFLHIFTKSVKMTKNRCAGM